MKTYAREQDGTTYYYIKGVLLGHPTNKDGTCDFDENIACPVAEYAEPLTTEEIQAIEKELA